MATVSTEGLEELIGDMGKIAEIPDDTILEMLSAQAEVVADAQKKKAQALGVFDTGKTKESITFKKKLKIRKDSKAIYVYPQGTRKDGNERKVAEVAFINEYGKHGQPARPFINTANEESADAANEAAMKVYDDFLKSKNL